MGLCADMLKNSDINLSIRPCRGWGRHLHLPVMTLQYHMTSVQASRVKNKQEILKNLQAAHSLSPPSPSPFLK